MDPEGPEKNTEMKFGRLFTGPHTVLNTRYYVYKNKSKLPRTFLMKEICTFCVSYISISIQEILSMHH